MGGSTPATASGTTGSPSTTTVGATTVYKWTGNGSITTTAGTARVVVVGGGAGGRQGNTAGGGGFVLDCIVTLTAATHTITVGAGSAANPSDGARAGLSSVGAFALASGGIAAASSSEVAGRSLYDGSWASGGAGGASAAASGTTGGAGVTSTVADGSTGVEYGRGGSYLANVASPANTGRGGDAGAGTAQAGADGVVFVVIG